MSGIASMAALKDTAEMAIIKGSSILRPAR